MEEDNEKFLMKLRDRIDRSICGKQRIASFFLNSVINVLESTANNFVFCEEGRSLSPSLHDVSGIIKPKRMTLLLGPPGSGKPLYCWLGRKIEFRYKVSGTVTYNGHGMDEFCLRELEPTSGQYSLHIGGDDYMLSELARRESCKHQTGPDVDVFMKPSSPPSNSFSLINFFDTGEMIVRPARALFMDEISTGLDSSTTYQIVNTLQQYIHILDGTAVVSLLQPAPETFDLFDDIILLSDSQVAYQGP
ncbi:hypothetical protein HPP92_019511 [Vanilla planifolia]|uniref:Uncharacterized protein n=1 Tax=Vanilla planifolia TaxID=51239 RepID=A0A835Q464_VANPL|nr:hypothetical protein HPP92_019959 [Vanilla planifolia]KAG0465347.1 hypothetical protein HPP92_019511 [Vanilla planifolia]